VSSRRFMRLNSVLEVRFVRLNRVLKVRFDLAPLKIAGMVFIYH
jgi:hypothetical protein